MKFLIDTSAHNLERRMSESKIVLGQLLTPLTRYRHWGGVYAIDNGAFSNFDEKNYKTLLARQDKFKDDCLFVTCPDIVGAGQRSVEIYKHRRRWIPEGWKCALVVQDGSENIEIPWDDMDCVFIGGKDPWKDSQCVLDIVRTAKILDKWVHVGRVNEKKRFDHFANAGADTCDGSGIARFDYKLRKIETRMPVLWDTIAC